MHYVANSYLTVSGIVAMCILLCRALNIYNSQGKSFVTLPINLCNYVANLSHNDLIFPVKVNSSSFKMCSFVENDIGVDEFQVCDLSVVFLT